MSDEQEMEYESLASRSIDVPPSASHRRSTSQRRGCSSNSARARGVSRSSSRVKSTPKPTRRNSQLSTQSSTIDISMIAINDKNENDLVPVLSSVPPSNLFHRSQLVTRSFPFELPSDSLFDRMTNTNTTVVVR